MLSHFHFMSCLNFILPLLMISIYDESISFQRPTKNKRKEKEREREKEKPNREITLFAETTQHWRSSDTSYTLVHIGIETRNIYIYIHTQGIYIKVQTKRFNVDK